jgi:hypothetical protein
MTSGRFHIKSALKGQRFQDTEAIRKNLMTALKAIQQWKFQHCWDKCMAAQGEYFEGDSSH